MEGVEQKRGDWLLKGMMASRPSRAGVEAARALFGATRRFDRVLIARPHWPLVPAFSITAAANHPCQCSDHASDDDSADHLGVRFRWGGERHPVGRCVYSEVSAANVPVLLPLIPKAHNHLIPRITEPQQNFSAIARTGADRLPVHLASPLHTSGENSHLKQDQCGCLGCGGEGAGHAGSICLATSICERDSPAIGPS